MKQTTSVRRLTLGAALLALGLVLPFITGQIQAISRWISPMHIPALICGLTCGPVMGLIVGFITPLLRGLLFGMPPIPNIALPMAFELAGYGLVAGLCYPALLRAMKNKNHLPALLIALVIAMVAGRVIGGSAKALLLALGVIGANSPFTIAAFLTSYFVETAPGAAIHIILIPAVVLALERAHLSPLAEEAV